VTKQKSPPDAREYEHWEGFVAGFFKGGSVAAISIIGD
jgi:hypothetical protein